MTIKLIIDMQAIQGISHQRGIGRYSLDFCLALKTYCQQLDVKILLNKTLPLNTDSVQLIIDKFSKNNVLMYNNINHSEWIASDSNWRQSVANIVLDTFIEQFNPDIVHHMSVFEGYTDNNSIGTNKKKIY